jgi:POT family proton-dependent oligopeptide transporter
MALATLIFWLGRKKYKKVPPAGIKKENFFTISIYALQNCSAANPDKKYGKRLVKNILQNQ